MGRQGDQAVLGGETIDARKAAIWSILAALGQLGLVAVGSGSTLYPAVVAVAYALVLPAVAILHVRHRAVRTSGAILGTITGTAAAVLGPFASVDAALLDAALFVLGMWWWTIGKMWVETAVVARPMGRLTAGLGAVAILAAVGSPLIAGAPVAPAMHLALAGWLVLLSAALLGIARDVPSR